MWWVGRTGFLGEWYQSVTQCACDHPLTHGRFFVLENGILRYYESKAEYDMGKGCIKGLIINVSQSTFDIEQEVSACSVELRGQSETGLSGGLCVSHHLEAKGIAAIPAPCIIRR